ncbi:organic hydroperoxide resistance protein [Phyllobacterium endophyticum]|jgi:Ohr subfamily peroxiredoxin|uniref:Organic hydroperoxide resistance protein n=1 Tax=Phyllobacterium endophyticum TaxID=1149773 RepID=A0A2P7AZ39_9HYPH|nr:organic hydroperoxide resistance protein [Phyllobacterium endophyticum]MBB3235942.1 Ohr subfamily peroxiredoxin [Phyllobacterium endophyticum]PSH59478.1 organic hydroperoxide resistance protein [Phyllobacterium endophyticum]TXR50263.1 organic hydroperoxide resistance protein [Phyllobacterium endophyticum]TYR41614.1 organic hydroperoxide resistance protein [Phyllobacterium endophyticum]
MNILYATKATATGGRDGRAASEDGRFTVALSTPKELGGNGGEGTNPEQLFGAGYSACFLGAVKYVASQKKVRLSEETAVTATVGIGPRDDGKGFGLDVALAVTLPGVEAAQAREIVDAAHVVCPYSEATRNNLNVRISIN